MAWQVLRDPWPWYYVLICIRIMPKYLHKDLEHVHNYHLEIKRSW